MGSDEVGCGIGSAFIDNARSRSASVVAASIAGCGTDGGCAAATLAALARRRGGAAARFGDEDLARLRPGFATGLRRGLARFGGDGAGGSGNAGEATASGQGRAAMIAPRGAGTIRPGGKLGGSDALSTNGGGGTAGARGLGRLPFDRAGGRLAIRLRTVCIAFPLWEDLASI